jgi:hypothetical protein
LWQGNLNAELVIVGQDWGDTRYFLTNRGREAARNPTNEILVKLLRSIGIEIAAPGAGTSGGGRCFLTNAALRLKQGGLQAKVDPEWFGKPSSSGTSIIRSLTPASDFELSGFIRDSEVASKVRIISLSSGIVADMNTRRLHVANEGIRLTSGKIGVTTTDLRSMKQ